MGSRPLLTAITMTTMCAAQALSQTNSNLPVHAGKFKPTMESLKAYECPEWFRDAKFGIWAHWGPQAVPMEGDWYARNMYREGSDQYKHHLATYGHPSKTGFKDIIPLWKAEKWDPDRLMKLYKAAGAKYFVSMGTHHDNFFLWKSKIHKWNSVDMGPHCDVVGEWQKAAKKNGLKFGVSEHLGASFWWFQTSRGADKEGPMKGVPYDGADPRFEDLYHFAAEPGDSEWYSKNPKWHRQWYTEIKELVDNYKPDLLYTDGGVPFGNEVGLSMIAHLYNQSAAAHGGVCQAVYNCKQLSDGRWVEDLERGIMPKIDPHPWQTDTSIGDWFYNKHWKFRPVSWVVHMLVDNVSKNGNLLLNVVQRPDGSLDPEVEQMLHELATWTKVHGEAIYGSRPWQVYGESRMRVRGGHFQEDYAYTAKDIRFTTKGATLYATALGWPEDGKLVVHSLAKPKGQKINHIESISLLGSRAKLKWTQTEEGLVVTLPKRMVSSLTATLKIHGSKLKAVPFEVQIPPVKPDKDGVLMLLPPDAEIHGSHLGVEMRSEHQNFGFWDSADEYVSWHVHLPGPGKYAITLDYATINDKAEVAFQFGGGEVSFELPVTGDWGAFRKQSLGSFETHQGGDFTAVLKPKDAKTWKAINVRSVVLKKM